jgi:hypothetical protein
MVPSVYYSVASALAAGANGTFYDSLKGLTQLTTEEPTATLPTARRTPTR